MLPLFAFRPWNNPIQNHYTCANRHWQPQNLHQKEKGVAVNPDGNPFFFFVPLLARQAGKISPASCINRSDRRLNQARPF
jgi:hypothetical protein